MFFQVSLEVEGALDREEYVDEDALDTTLEEWQAYVTAGPNPPEDWRLFALAHYCYDTVAEAIAASDDDECSCAQYATDHHPVRSSEGV